MRFVFAIAALVVAAVLIVLGIAQRTVFLGPSTVSMETTVDTELPYTVIDGAVLGSHPGQQSITVSGADEVFLAYGTTADVVAWIGENDYTSIQTDNESGELTSEVIKPENNTPVPEGSDDAETEEQTEEEIAAAADPRGSDLWLAEQSEERALITTVSLPEDMSVIIASDGVAPAPEDIELSWPLNNSTPWAGPLIALGFLLLVVGIVLYFLGLRHMRRSRGPRRKSITSGPGLEQTPKSQKQLKPRRTRERALPKPKRTPRRSMRAVVPVVLVSGLALGGCSADYWPDLSLQNGSTPTPTPTTPAEEAAAEAAPPVVTVPQLERIVARIATTATQADEALDADLAQTRFDGPALDERTANYAIRASVPDAGLPTPIPGSPVTLTLPQASASWPRTVMTVISDEQDETIAPTALVMMQQSPRENYHVEYALQLEPDAQIPDVAPATIGAALVPAELQFLLVAPDTLGAAYADLISRGSESESAGLFETEDSLRTAIAADREKKTAELPSTASIEFSAAAGDGVPLALVTNESGAIVAAHVVEKEVVRPIEADAQVRLSGGIAALAGVTETTKGVEATYSDELLFYVPPAGSNEKIVLLGFRQALVAAKEIE
ncbi:hypothetical protein GCM10027416_14050 [Okibacterium endophyticum]